MEEHTSDLRNVEEGDTLDITTGSGETLRVECTARNTESADPRSGEVRDTIFWHFDVDGGQVFAAITEGLRSSEDDPEFPIHMPLWDARKDQRIGYIDEVKIRGKMES